MSEKHMRSVRTQIGQFAMVPRWVLERVQVVARDRGWNADRVARAIHLYTILGAKYANHHHRAYPSREQLAADLGVSSQAVALALRLLRVAGALTTARRHRHDGAVIGLEYILVQVDPCLASEEASHDDGDEDHLISGNQKGLAGHQIPGDQKDSNVHSIPGDQKAVHGLLIPPATKAAAFLSPERGPSDPQSAFAVHKEEPYVLNHIRTLSTASTSPHKKSTLLAAYHAAFVARFPGTTPHIHGAKDGRLLKTLADRFTDAHVRELLGWFFRIADPFIEQSGYTVGVFDACFNRLQLTFRPPADPTQLTEAQAARAAMHARSEQTQAELEAHARNALVAASHETRQALQQVVLKDLERSYPTVRACMAPDAFERAIRTAMIRETVERARRLHLKPVQVLDAFARGELRA